MSSRRAGPPDSISALVKMILGSRIHGLLSGSLILIAIRGRTTGREFILSVQYAERDGTIYVVPGRVAQKTWWRNLLGGGPVRMRLRGSDCWAWGAALSGKADPHASSVGLGAWLGRFPRAARLYDVRPRPDGRFDLRDIERAAADAIVVRLTPVEPLLRETRQLEETSTSGP